MTEEHENQAALIEDQLAARIGKKLFRHALLIVSSVMTCTFAVALAYAALKNDTDNLKQSQAVMEKKIDALQSTQDAANTATVARIVDWSKWRVLKDAADDNYERRLAWLESVERNRKP